LLFFGITIMPRNAFSLQHEVPILSLSQLLQLKHPEPLPIIMARLGLSDLQEEAPTLEQVFPVIAKEGRDNITPELLSETGLGDFTSPHLAKSTPRKGDYDFENMRFFPLSPVKEANCGFCGWCLGGHSPKTNPLISKSDSELPGYLPQSCEHHRYNRKPMIYSGYSPLVQVPQTPFQKKRSRLIEAGQEDDCLDNDLGERTDAIYTDLPKSPGQHEQFRNLSTQTNNIPQSLKY